MHHTPARYYEDVEIGEQIPEFRRQTGYIEWGRFAGANEEYVAIHEDHEAGLQSGLPGGVGMGNLRMAYVSNMLCDWLGEHGWLQRVTLQYRGLNLENDWVICKGTVTAKYEKDGQFLVELDVRTENGKGEVTAPGKAIVSLPSRRNR